MSQHERSYWRDERLSLRHRLWGHDCPCTDIDFLVAEYDQCRAVAIVEYKHKRASTKLDANHRVLIDLAERARLPLFRVVYDSDDWSFYAQACNGWAFFFLGNPTLSMDEKEWVDFLYRLRGRDIPDAVRHILCAGAR